jgi:acyl-[acyl-carrier-protein]-phospholipid O-acyltransferase/long-chain-fatty-acid--[acyl-carrier-protein] ligase
LQRFSETGCGFLFEIFLNAVILRRRWSQLGFLAARLTPSMSTPSVLLKSSLVLHADRLTGAGALVVPSRLSGGDLLRLAAIADGRKLCVLLDASASYTSEQQSAIAQYKDDQFTLQEARAAADVSRSVQAGNLVVFVPGPVVAQAATSVTISRVTLQWLAELDAPVQPLFVDHPRESKLRLEQAAQHKESVLSFGPLIAASAVTVAQLWESLLVAGVDAYSARHTFTGHIGQALVRGIKAFGGRAKLFDGTDNTTTSYHRILAAAIVLSKEIKNFTKQPRIGIVLPPGKGAMVANLAAILAGKIPVNLNFTASKESIESAIKQAEIDRFLTADIFVRKMQAFPWPPIKHLMFLERLLPQWKNRIIRWLLLVKTTPASALVKLLNLPKLGGEEEATLLFTSGSSGEPKGVVLSHKNLLANVNQFGSRLNLTHQDKILGCLPLFHSFGSTVTFYYALVEGLSVVSFPSPMDTPKLAELIEQHRVSLMVATPTFLRGYLKRAKKEQLASVKFVVTGAEKLPLALEEEFRKRFDKPVLEGYGLTETSPATNLNLPDPEADAAHPNIPVLPSRRLGSVGQLLPGVAVRITSATTEEPLPVDQSGMIWLRGPNVFGGYLKQPRKTEEVLQQGWFRTGDIGRLDADGFLYIEGRLSRFSKIAGEMVPHETIEDQINRALGFEGESERKIAVVGLPDPDKGEMLVLLSTVATAAVKQELINLRYTLLDRGVPSLWIPKKLVPVQAIPILQSGKLDIKGCEKLAARPE